MRHFLVPRSVTPVGLPLTFDCNSSGVTLHSSKLIPVLKGKSIQLLTRFREHETAKNLQKVLLETLDSVGLEISDIRGITSDAARTMIKLAKNLQKLSSKPLFHQLCFAHGIHLAVVDTFKGNTDVGGLPDVEEEEADDAIWNIVELPEEDDPEGKPRHCIATLISCIMGHRILSQTPESVLFSFLLVSFRHPRLLRSRGT